MTMTKLICPDCQHENEPERIYCHNCGARLDRTGLIKEKVDEAVAEERTRQHLKKMFRPNRGRGKRIATKLGKTFLGALCLAVVLVMLLPPDLPPAPKNYTFAPMIGMDMMSAVSSHQAASLVYNEEQANSYLASHRAAQGRSGPTGLLPAPACLRPVPGRSMLGPRRTPDIATLDFLRQRLSCDNQ